jgi:hypothetical protein
MPTLRDNLSRWREAAQIDWFSQFVRAWIPFNAWMTDTFGDLQDKQMLDRLKSGTNVVYNGIVPMLTITPRAAPDLEDDWRNNDDEAKMFRRRYAMLHKTLESCLVEGRRGRISFDTVDVGANQKLFDQQTLRGKTLRVERNIPAKENVSVSIKSSTGATILHIVQLEHNRRELEDHADFQRQTPECRARLLAMHMLIVPRTVQSVLSATTDRDAVLIEGIRFVRDEKKLFAALVEVIYGLRNALFHGSITPNDQHNQIYEPAYHLVMRMVKCTI